MANEKALMELGPLPKCCAECGDDGQLFLFPDAIIPQPFTRF